MLAYTTFWDTTATYSGENIVAKIIAIYDSSRDEYSFCSSISSVELLNNSRQYMTKGLFIDIDNDCFYTDGNIFISTSLGETKDIMISLRQSTV